MAGAPAPAPPRPADASEQPPPVTLQDLAATPDLGALIMGAIPLPERVRLRGLCRAFAAAVDASLQVQDKITAEDLFGLDKWGQTNGDTLCWLAVKCPNLRTLQAQGDPGRRPGLHQRWWKLPSADAIITHLAAHCRQVRVLNLYGCTGVGDAGLVAVAANCGDLRQLDIGFCELVTDAGVSAIAAGCRRLEQLDVGSVRGVTDVGVSSLAVHSASLRELNVYGTGVSNSGIVELARRCAELRSLDVSFCEGVDDHGVVALAEGCPLLESLDYALTRVGDPGTAAIMHKCSQLKKLSLGQEARDAAVRLGPRSCRRLRALSVTSRFVTDVAVIALAECCGELRSLSFLNCPSATDASLSGFAESCPLLEELSCESCERISDAGVLAVARGCPRLVAVSMQGCGNVTDASMVELVKSCPGLQRLNLSWTYAGNRAVHAIARHCRGLRSLDLSGLPVSILWGGREDGQLFFPQRTWEEEIQWKDDGLACVLQSCLFLEKLELSACHHLSDAGIRVIGDSCKSLRELHIRGSGDGLTPQGLAAMAPNLGSLEVLDATFCRAVTDTSVAALAAHCPRLRFVDVSGSSVSDDGISALVTRCPLLATLKLARCVGVTDVGMVNIAEAGPPLEELMLSYCRGVTLSGAMAIASECKGLRDLDVIGCSLSGGELQVLRGACQHLESLKYDAE